MGLDIKLPIGLMFLIFGVVLTVFGIITNANAELYTVSLNHNINLWSGIFMIVFGGLMLMFSKGLKRKK